MPPKKFAKFELNASSPVSNSSRPNGTPAGGKKSLSFQEFQSQQLNKKTESAASSDNEYMSSNQSSRLTTPSQSTTSLTGLNQSFERLLVSPISELLEEFKNGQSLSDLRKTASEISAKINGASPDSINQWEIHQVIKLLAGPKSGSPLLKEGSMVLLQNIITHCFNDKAPYEVYLIQFLPLCLSLLVAKETAVVHTAQKTLDLLYAQFAYPTELLDEVLKYLQSSAKWKCKVGALKLVNKIVEDSDLDLLKLKFYQAIPVLTDVSSDFKPELAKEGLRTLTNFVEVLKDNLDLEKNLPVIIAALNDPKKIGDCIKSLASTTFVTEVTESTLAVLVPSLNKSMNLSSSSQDQLRLTITIMENLTRLVSNYREVERYLPILLPSVQKIIETGTLPEVRELASKSLVVLNKADEYAKNDTTDNPKALRPLFGYKDAAVVNYVVSIVDDLAVIRQWQDLEEYLGALGEQSKLEQIKALYKAVDEDDIHEDEGIEIVNTNFSLAYGGRMLLNKTKLRLIKGHRYGLCGRNGAGKSTLMRAINNGQVDGFPSKDELRTCFVEHKVPTDDEKSNDWDLVSLLDSELENSKEEITTALAEVGFDAERRAQAINSLSGGWRMKLALAKAILMKADILLLDEPTNHLDVSNVAWLEQYLLDHTDITSLIVSHDSGFLDRVCTNIIHYENKKLVYYKGNLSELVKVKPEAKSYYTLTDSNAKMAFPKCGLLQGIKSRTKAVAKMVNVQFTYPGGSKPSLSDVTCSLSLSSRVAILGPNGAGKSTLIKLLTAELVPDSGKVEKHPNLRIGYIAQHALQHVEQHKEKTANQYLQWRYKFGDDREVLLKESRKISEDEKELMKTQIDVGDGRGPRIIEAIVGRQKLKKSFQYEVKWKSWLPRYNSWVSKDVLSENGFDKLVQKFDDHEASREGLGYRDLSPKVIRQHFEDVGLDGEIADHTPMGSLSGGQLVKVVIAGAMWNNPHLLVLDEPTNYLDRDSLGALAVAIRDWNGGVVMISHNNEFTGALCPEQWVVENGKMVTKNIESIHEDRFEDGKHGEVAQHVVEAAYAKTDETDDSPANIRVRERKKKLTRNEKKARDERRRLRHINWLSSPKGTPKPEDTDDEA